MKISVILISHDESEQEINTQLKCIACQQLQPYELIFIDTSKNKVFEDTFNDYFKSNQNLNHKYFHSPDAYPGLARNVGVHKSTGDVLAFLDMKTKPSKDWLIRSKSLGDNGVECILGTTYFEAKNTLQNLYKASTYGEVIHTTLPGTIIYRDAFFRVGEFNSNVRAGEDILWKNAALKILDCIIPEQETLKYHGLPNSFFKLVKKYIRYSFDGAILDVQHNVKTGYLTLFLIFTFLIIPRWNYLFTGWDESFFYIEDVTKKGYLFILILFICYAVIKKIFNTADRSPLFNVGKYISYLIVFLIVIRWNAVLTDFTESASLYIPHITKIFLASVIVLSIIFRGIIKPLSNGVRLNKLFPFFWFQVGLIGSFLDMIRAPIYVTGSVIGVFKSK